MKYLLLMILVTWGPGLLAQDYISLSYQIATDSGLVYGQAVDVAGNTRTLALDISYPTDDTASTRPLMVLVHGGAFLTGTRRDPSISRMREEFAQRGYVTAAVDYRLGMFQTASNINCNVGILGLEWNCLNETATSEWYRAWFRGVQDVNGAIRWLVNHAGNYQIDPEKVFAVGESAGGFIAMGVGYLDDSLEVLAADAGALPDAPAPNAIYEQACVQAYGIDTNIASMDLSRPDLGHFRGDLNLPAATPHCIRGVGSFYGGVFNNIFASPGTSVNMPGLYLFHQPNDLIVPYDFNRVLAGYAYCVVQNTSCIYIVNRPFVYGGQGIAHILDSMDINGASHPDYLFETTNNNTPCLQQGSPSLAGHAIDNFSLRTANMATFFAPRLDSNHSCTVATGREVREEMNWKMYPVPLPTGQSLRMEAQLLAGDRVEIWEGTGKMIWRQTIEAPTTQWEISDHKVPGQGLYYVRWSRGQSSLTRTIVVLE